MTALNTDRVDKERKRATATLFDLAQGSLQAVKSKWETNKKAGIEEKIKSINNKEVNSTYIEEESLSKKQNFSIYRELQSMQIEFV